MKVQHVKDLVLYLPLDVPHILVLLLFGRKSAGNIKFLRKPFAKSCVLEGLFCSTGGVRGAVMFRWSTGGGFQRGRSVPLEHWGWVSEGPFCSTGALGVGFRGAALFNWNTGGGSSKKVKLLKLQYICHISVGYAVSGGCFIHPLPPSVLVLFFVQAPDVCCFLYRPLMRAVLCISP